MKTIARRVAGRLRRIVDREVVSRIRSLKPLPADRGLSAIDPKKPVYVFFAPEAGVTPHFAAHCIVARTLQELGQQVLMVRCDSYYRQCVVMDMFSLTTTKTPKQRKEVCDLCRAAEVRMRRPYGLPSADLGEFISTKTIEDIKQQCRSMPFDAGKFEVDGIRFGALCSSDLALSMKTLDQLRVTGEAREMLEAYVSGALTSYRAMQALFQKLNVARVIFFNEYGMLAGAALAAIKAGIPVTRITHPVHKNIDRQKINILHDPLTIITYHKSLDEWPRWRDLALSPKQVGMLVDNQLSRFGASGHTVYSARYSGAASDIFERLALAPERKTLVAYTSSVDEFNSNLNLMSSFGVDLFQKEQPFSDQMEWLDAVIGYVERSEHLQLVIRIHPREGKTSRDNNSSEHLKRLIEHFSGSYKHVRIIWPEDPTSSYDLSEIADVALSGWSNITMELARLGVPVLTAFYRYVPFPVPDVVAWEPTSAGYFRQLERMIGAPVTLDRIRYAFRWSYVYSLSMSVDFGDVVPAPDYHGLPPFKMAAAAGEVEAILVDGKSAIEINRQKIVAAQSIARASEETAALCQQIRRMIWFLATGEDRAEDYQLLCGDQVKSGSADLVIDIYGDFVELSTTVKTVRRRSQVLRRLGLLAANVESRSTSSVDAAW
jgi:hypothetical protein